MGPGVLSASSEADDSDNLYGWSFNRSHHLWWPVGQVTLTCCELMFPFTIFIMTVYHLSNQPESVTLFRFGRRSVLIWSYLQLAILGCSAALSPTYSVYCILRFLCGMAVSGIIINGVSLSKGLLLCCSWSADSFLFYSQWFSFCLLSFPHCLQRWNGSQPKRGL